MINIDEPSNIDDEMMSDYYYALALLLYGPHWWAKPGCNLYADLATTQQVKFSRLVMSIVKKNNGSAATLSDLWRFTEVVCNEPHMRFCGKLRVIFTLLPRLLILTGILALIFFGLSLVVLLLV